MESYKNISVTDDSFCNSTSYEVFESVDELVKETRLRPHLRNDDRLTMEITDFDWYQCKSYEDAEDLALNGWKGLLEKSEFIDFYKRGKGVEDKLFKMRNDVVGFAPIVPNVLRGIPQSMINVDKKKVKSKVIHIVYNISCLAGVSGSRIMDIGFKVMSAIVDLEKQGYRIRLTALQDFCKNSQADLLMIKVKDENRKLDVYSSMFTLCHTAVFRLIGFAWHERSPVCRDFGMGYGRKYSDVFGSYKPLKSDLNTILHDKNLVLINADDLVYRDLTVELIEELILKYGRSFGSDIEWR